MSKKILSDLEFAAGVRLRSLPVPTAGDEPTRLAEVIQLAATVVGLAASLQHFADTEDFAEITADVAALETDVGTLETDVGTLETDVGTLETDVGTLETAVGTLETAVGTLETDVDALQTAGQPAAITWASTTNIALDKILRTVALTGDTTFTTSARTAGARTDVVLTADSTERTLTFPTGWVWVGGTAPAALAAGKTALLKLISTSTTDAAIVAQYLVQS